MNTNKLCFVLGAQDPEMREIENVLRKAGIPYGMAGFNRFRCSAREAYCATEMLRVASSGRIESKLLHPHDPVALVECGAFFPNPVIQVFDHHNEGDPGYFKEPHEYQEGSSLGQVLQYLDETPTDTQKLLMAGDHCLTAGYQGECPEVDPGELLFLRASWKAKISNRSLYEVIECIEKGAKLVRAKLNERLGYAEFKDPTRIPPELAEGSAYAGIAVRYWSLNPDGTLKVMMKGGSPEQIKAFMAEYAEHSVYGNPQRGYAGAYLTA